MRSLACRAAAAASVLAAAIGGLLGRSPEEGLRSLAEAAGQSAPLVRIGLDSGHRVLLSSPSAFRILDPASGAPIWKESYAGEVAVVAEGGPEGEIQVVYRVQVGAFATKEAADTERDRLESVFGAPGVVRYVPDRGSWRVRLGAATDREALASLIGRLRASGLEGVWITEEAAQEPTGVTLRVVDRSFDSAVTKLDRLAVVPRPGSVLHVEGKPYRGIIEVRVTAAGTVRAIDWVEIENYLLGVVPAELGPEIWPELDALRAQAVAARTYVWRNLGQFADEGFDLCATPRCQVYSGVSAEHPMSDRAVASTRGEILTWEGKPISALYTATCGGHTEDASEIFPEEKAPYLKGVPCRAEPRILPSLRTTIAGRSVAPLISETGEDVTRDWALLAAAGVVPGRDAKDARERIAPRDLRAAVEALLHLAGRSGDVSQTQEKGTGYASHSRAGDAGSLGKVAASIVRDAGWDGRARVLLSEDDLPAILRDEEALALPPEERRALGYLALVGGITPFPDGRFHPDRAPSRARIVPALARIGEACDAFSLKEAVVAGADASTIRLVQGKGELRLPVAPSPFLLSLAGGKVATASRLTLWPGDRVRFRTNAEGQVDFLELRPPVKGVSDDRSAKVYSWEVRQTRAELEEVLHRRLDVGRLRDLVVVRRGVSGRVVEMRVVGDRGSSLVKGFDVRTLLGLRESLMVIEAQRDASGEIEAVVFSGKGWGHGVGLCQVGAYGMALRGTGYREILGHYYRGAAVEKIAIGR